MTYTHNSPHCSGNNVRHHQKVKLMFVFMLIFYFFLTLQIYDIFLKKNIFFSKNYTFNAKMFEIA